jgi:hypothetical protein
LYAYLAAQDALGEPQFHMRLTSVTENLPKITGPSAAKTPVSDLQPVSTDECTAVAEPSYPASEALRSGDQPIQNRNPRWVGPDTQPSPWYIFKPTSSLTLDDNAGQTSGRIDKEKFSC